MAATPGGQDTGGSVPRAAPRRPEAAPKSFRDHAEAEAAAPDVLWIGGASVDLETGCVRAADGAVTELRPKAAALLRALAARPGALVAKDALLAEVWAGRLVDEDGIVQCVGEIRRALGPGGRDAIRTHPKRGYSLQIAAPDPAGPAGPQGVGLDAGRQAWPVAVAALILAVLGLAAWTLRPAPVGAGLPRIAVLPFENLSGDPRWERLGRGLAAEIGTDLSRRRAIVVIPAETAEGAAGEPMAAAEALSARFVLDGTLQAEGEELRVTARLTDAEEGAVVWSDRWARPVEDVFAVQDEIVERIGRAGRGTPKDVVAQTVLAGAGGRPLRSLDAYELYLLADEAKYSFTPEGFEEAIGYLRRAIEIDPNLTAARVALSIAVMNWSDHMDDEAEAAALVAESFRLAEQAAETDPDNPYALVRLCTVRVLQDRRAEAWPLAARAVELAPLSPDLLADAAWCYPFADQGRAPLDWAERAVALNPAHGAWYNVGLAMSALFAGDLDLARRAAPPMPDVLVTLAATEALSGNVEEARAWFDRFAAETRFRSLSAFLFVEDMSADPAWGPWVEGARLAGFPVTEAEAGQAASR